MHPLLLRQLRKAFAQQPASTEFAAFLRAVDDAYLAADHDRKQLEHSLHLASDELFERNCRLESELEERKRLELELRVAEKLRAVGQLAAGIAHEINTPMQFIGDSVQFLEQAMADLEPLFLACDAARVTGDAAGKLPMTVEEMMQAVDLAYLRSEIPRALQRCVLGTLRVTKIVHALKDLAHPDSSTQEMADINRAIENTLIVAAGEIKYVANVQLELHCDQPVRCHIGEIQQVLLNLMVNAGHAIAERVGKSGQMGCIKVSSCIQAEDIVVSIADDGAGIPVEVRDRIFDPFFTTKPIGKGTGQGLPIARSLVVERHGGQLLFESTLGKGTTFTMRLPLNGRRKAG